MILLMSYWQLSSFCLTLMSLPFWPKIPDVLWCSAIVLYGIANANNRAKKILKYGLGISTGLLLATLYANMLLEQSRTLFEFGENITINIKVDSDFTKNNFGFNGQVLVTAINGCKLDWYQQPRIKLYGPVMLQQGNVGEFFVALKPIYGQLNQAGMDSERYYFSQAILGKAFVVRDTPFYVVTHESWRQWFKQKVTDLVQAHPHSSFLMALSFADRTGITSQQWQWLKASGLSHLVAISGLHIGIAFGLGASMMLGLTRFLQRGYWLAFPVGMLVAIGYSGLAGFTLPTQRALVMLIIATVLYQFAVRMSHLQRLLWVFAIMVALNPLAIVSTSFWLSFLAVAIVIYVMLGQRYERWWVNWLRSHMVLSVIMLPLIALVFNGVSLVSPFYNMFFVPWFSFVVVPLLFLALVLTLCCPALADVIWSLADLSLFPLSYLLPFASDSWIALSHDEIRVVTILVALLIASVLLRRRWLIFVLLALCLLPNRASRYDWRIDLLDVGQGLAVLIEQQGEYLLYDTGPAWHGGSSADLVISPVLEQRGAAQLDTLVLSHLDNDHAGGRLPIEQRWNPIRRLASSPLVGYLPCTQGVEWQWHRLNVLVIWPPALSEKSSNPFSCVVQISDRKYGHSVLLAGDIEKQGEWLMVKQAQHNGQSLDSDILIVPHHGSSTSSSAGLINAVNPSLALASLAKGNRWGFPDTDVVQRYRDDGVQWLDSGDSGQVTIEFTHDQRRVTYLRDRDSLFHYQPWYRQMLRKQVE
jgi:competence protein ComEC